MKKTVILTTGKVVNLSIVSEYCGDTTIRTDVPITEDEADEIANIDF